jgi:16S rRNA (uracil1498-N3)-methyltransferase
MIRCYCESVTGPELVLDAVQAHHLRDVLRLGAGAEVELFDGNGTTARGIIRDIARSTITLSVEEIHHHPPQVDRRIILAVSLAKGSRFDDVITRCTELGVDHLVGVRFTRTVKQAAGPAAARRRRNLAISAAQQCGRVFLPRLTGPENFEGILETLRAEYPGARWLFGGFSAQARPLLQQVDMAADTIVVVGPEGGLTEAEQDRLRKAGASEVSLTRTTLRIETAAVAVGAVLCVRRDGPDPSG